MCGYVNDEISKKRIAVHDKNRKGTEDYIGFRPGHYVE